MGMLTTLLVTAITLVIYSSAQQSTPLSDLIIEENAAPAFTIPYDLENHAIELYGCDRSDYPGDDIQFLLEDGTMVGGVRWVFYASYFVIHIHNCEGNPSSIGIVPFRPDGSARVWKVAISRDGPNMNIKVYADDELAYEKYASRETCKYWYDGGFERGPITKLKFHSIFYRVCFDGFNAALIDDNSGGNGNGGDDNGNGDDDRVPYETNDYKCFPGSFCPGGGDYIFKEESLLQAECSTNEKCTGVEYFVKDASEFGRFCYGASYTEEETSFRLEGHRLCIKLAVLDGGNDNGDDDNGNGDDDNGNGDDDNGNGGDDNGNEGDDNGNGGDDNGNGDDDNGNGGDDNGNGDDDNDNDDKKDKKDKKDDDDDDDDDEEPEIVLEAAKSSLSCKTDKKCVVRFDVKYDNGKKIKKKLIDYAGICKVENGTRTECKKAKFKKNQLKLRLGGKKKTPASVAGEYVCVVQVDGDEAMSESTVQVTVK